MSRLIDADELRRRMYNEVFESDSEDQRWDSGCWIRYRLFEKILKEQPTSEIQNSSDCISRQAAIDAIEDTDWYHQNKNKDMVHGANSSEHQAWYKAEDVYKALENVPAAQQKPLKYTGDSICLYCQTADCDGCIYEPMEGVQ